MVATNWYTIWMAWLLSIQNAWKTIFTFKILPILIFSAQAQVHNFSAGPQKKKMHNPEGCKYSRPAYRSENWGETA
jgi:hypothetical protein